MTEVSVRYIEDVPDVTDKQVKRFRKLHERIRAAHLAPEPEFVRIETSDDGFLYKDKLNPGGAHYKEDRYGNLMLIDPARGMLSRKRVEQITGRDKVMTITYIESRVVADYQDKQIVASNARRELKQKEWDGLLSREWG